MRSEEVKQRGLESPQSLTSNPDESANTFALTSIPSEVHQRFVREVIDRTLAKRRRKEPHQCVTVKLPYNDYARVTRVRFLESPSDDLRPVLEAHRTEVRAQREAEAKKRGRGAMRRK